LILLPLLVFFTNKSIPGLLNDVADENTGNGGK
jgi:hypothetical protein